MTINRIKWCEFCQSYSHNDNECSKTRPADWKKPIERGDIVLPAIGIEQETFDIPQFLRKHALTEKEQLQEIERQMKKAFESDNSKLCHDLAIQYIKMKSKQNKKQSFVDTIQALASVVSKKLFS